MNGFRMFFIFLALSVAAQKSFIFSTPTLIQQIPTLKQSVNNKNVTEQTVTDYTKLVKKGLAIHDALECAKLTNRNDTNIDIKIAGINLFIALLEKDEALKRTIETIRNTIKNENSEQLRNIIKLLKPLLTEEDKKVTQEQITKNTVNFISNFSDFQFFLHFYKNGDEKKLFLKTAKLSIDFDDKESQEKISTRIFSLYNHEKNIQINDEVLKYSKQIANILLDTKPIKSLDLYYLLVIKNKAIDDAIKAVKKAYKSLKKEIIDDDLKRSISKLTKSLIKKNNISQQDNLDLTIIAIELGIKLSKINNLSSLLDEFSNKVDRNKDFENATKLAIATMKINDSDLVKKAINILLKLIEKGQTTEGMVNAIEYGLESLNHEIKMETERLIEKLLEKPRVEHSITKEKLIEKLLKKLSTEYSTTLLLLLKLCIPNWDELNTYALKNCIKESIQICLILIQTLDKETKEADSDKIGSFLSILEKNINNFQEIKGLLNTLLEENPIFKPKISEEVIQEISDDVDKFEKHLDDWTKKTIDYLGTEYENIRNWTLINNFEQNLKTSLKKIESFNSQLLEYQKDIWQVSKEKRYNLTDPLDKLKIKIQKIRIQTFDKFTKILGLVSETKKDFTINKNDVDAIAKEREEKKPPKIFMDKITTFMIDTFAGNRTLKNLLDGRWHTEIETENIIKITGEEYTETQDLYGITRVMFALFSKYLMTENFYKIWSEKSDDFFIPTTNENEKNKQILKAISFFMVYSLKNRKLTSIFLNMPIFAYDFLLYGKEDVNALEGKKLDERLLKWSSYFEKAFSGAKTIYQAYKNLLKLNPTEEQINESKRLIDEIYLFEQEMPKDKNITSEEIKRIILKEIIKKIIPEKKTNDGLMLMHENFWGLNEWRTMQTQQEQLNSINTQLSEAQGWTSQNKLITAMQTLPMFKVLLFQIFLRFLQPEDLQQIFYPEITVDNIKIEYKTIGAIQPPEEDIKKIKNHVNRFLEENKNNKEILGKFVKFITGGLYPEDIKIEIKLIQVDTDYQGQSVHVEKPFFAHTCFKTLDIILDSEEEQIRNYLTFKESLEAALATIN